MSREKSHIQWYHFFFLIVLSVFIFTIITRSWVSYTGSDSQGALLTTQSIIENGTIKLDNYPNLKMYTYKVQKKYGHYYYYFPIGTSVSSIPFIWFKTQVLNHDMNNLLHDHIAQKQIAGIVSALIFLLLFSISKMYFTSGTSIVISFVFWLGTSLSSTLGQALWSQDFATLYALLSIFVMLKIVKENKNTYWVFLGLALFMAYFSRPTMLLLSITVILYIFLNHKKYIAIKTASLVGLLLGIFVLFSLSEFNQLLPDYYLPKRLSSSAFWTALYGNLFSPARGLFIFSPFLLIFLFDAKDTYRIFRGDKTLAIIAAWIILHLVAISKFPHWWAGHSYGPRFMAEILPAIFLLLVVLLSHIHKKGSLFKKRLIFLFLMITVPLSIYFNTVQGLYNQYSGSWWNSTPNIDQYPEYLFNWQYPQFLYNEEKLFARIEEFAIKHMSPIHPKQSIKFYTKGVAFIGWAYPETTHRYSNGNTSSILLKITDKEDIKGILKLHIATLGKQEIRLAINEHYIDNQTVDSSDTNISFKFNKNLLIADETNTIKFEFPNAHKPSNGDERVLAMALKSFSIE